MLCITSGPFNVRSSNTDDLRNPYIVRLNSTIALQSPYDMQKKKILSVAVCSGKPAIAGQGCTYCADASEPGEAKHLGSCCSFLQAVCWLLQAPVCPHCRWEGVHVLAAGSGPLFAHPVDVVLFDRNKKILHVGRALLLCKASREKEILCVYGGPSHGVAWQGRACVLIANHSSL